MKTAAKMKAVRKGLLVLVTAYKKIAIAIGSKNHKLSGAKAPDRTAPLTKARRKLTIAALQSFDLYSHLIHIAFAKSR